ncbi:MAG: type IV pilin protein, partial [Chromatiales bacterium]|nr:type IV pilin protein [Chromatiales bacterium]
QNDRYDRDKAGNKIALPFTQYPQDGEALYLIDFSADPTQETYTLMAIPQGSQAKDSCGTLTLNNAGNTDAAKDNCWK